jgi:hypothetical protein
VELHDDDRRLLTDLSHRYASHVDDRDLEALGDLFTEDAVLVSAAGTREGRAAILAAMAKLERYDRTFHLVGQVRLWAEADGPHGETYCVAHHFLEDGDAMRDRVMYIRYRDTFAHDLGRDVVWRFARRELDVVWAGNEPKLDTMTGPR